MYLPRIKDQLKITTLKKDRNKLFLIHQKKNFGNIKNAKLFYWKMPILDWKERF